MYVVAARFSTKTWDEQCAYYAKKRIAGCVYGSPQPMAKSIPYGAPVFVLEMNLSTRRIMGLDWLQMTILLVSIISTVTRNITFVHMTASIVLIAKR